MHAETAQRFVTGALANPLNAALLRRLPSLDLPDCWLVAGCLFQTVWNQEGFRVKREAVFRSGVRQDTEPGPSRATPKIGALLESGNLDTTGIKDYDLFYFDGSDLSWEAEDRAIRATRAALADLDIAIDVKNQARVHLWYERRFGGAYPRLRAACDGIDRFLIAGTCIGIAVGAGPGHRAREAVLYVPFGLDDVFAGVLRPNPMTIAPALFQAKAESYCARWPHLTIETTPAPMPQRSCQLSVEIEPAK